jgi:hydrogenase maturation factor HypE
MEETNARVIAEVEGAFQRYETALVAGYTTGMAELFWTSPDVSRFGAGDYLVGVEELAAFGEKRGPLASARELDDTRIVAFGGNAAVVDVRAVHGSIAHRRWLLQFCRVSRHGPHLVSEAVLGSGTFEGMSHENDSVSALPFESTPT